MVFFGLFGHLYRGRVIRGSLQEANERAWGLHLTIPNYDFTASPKFDHEPSIKHPSGIGQTVKKVIFCCTLRDYWGIIFSRGHATLELAVSVGRSVGLLVHNIFDSRNIFDLQAISAYLPLPNKTWVYFLLYCSCPPVRDWGGVYTALFYLYFGIVELH